MEQDRANRRGFLRRGALATAVALAGCQDGPTNIADGQTGTAPSTETPSDSLMGTETSPTSDPTDSPTATLDEHPPGTSLAFETRTSRRWQ